MATIDRLDLRPGEHLMITARGFVTIDVRESGGRLIIVGPLDHHCKTIAIERDVKVTDSTESEKREAEMRRG